jgi:methenyltetrahydromethanopterin cyclohydrolase
MPSSVPNSYGRPVFFDVELKNKDYAIYQILRNIQAPKPINND